MLTIPFIRENKAAVIERLAIKNFTNITLLDDVLELDEQRRLLQKESDDTLAETNKLAREIGEMYKSGKAQQANLLKETNAALKEKAKTLGEQLELLKHKFRTNWSRYPTCPTQMCLKDAHLPTT